MTYAYRLAGEDLELAEAELRGFLRSQGVEEEPERTDRIAFTDSEPDQLKRLALTHEAVKVVERTGELDTDYRPERRFAVRAKDYAGDREEEIERELGEVLSTEENEVDLDHPRETVRVYGFEEQYVIGRTVEDIDRGLFQKRENEERPFQSPVSMDPVLARVLVNLSGVEPGGHVLDPFCGTGGILIEAGLCGVGVHGLDIQEEMVEGTRENLEEYGVIVHDIQQGEVSEALEMFGGMDAVVTDLPYGKASKTEGNPVEDLFDVLEGLADRAVVVSDREELRGMEPDHSVYVHGSMTRYIYQLSL
ncbi:MAG: methyltransferase domain-containing protein [Candidatus Nanohaloarchaea archaeon]